MPLVIAQRYTLEECLAKRRHEATYRAIDSRLMRPVIVKILNYSSRYAMSESIVARFARQARIMSQLSHPGLAQVYDFDFARVEATDIWPAREWLIDSSNMCYYVTSEYLSGINLARYLKEHGAIEPERVVEIGRQVALALHAMHSNGVIHRGLRPQKVFMGTGDTIKIVDFDSARYLNDTATVTTMAYGIDHGLEDVAYLPPEVLEGVEFGVKGDVYALGVLLYELLLAKRPYHLGDTLLQALAYKAYHDVAIPPEMPDVVSWRLPGNIPWNLRSLISRCLALDLDQRIKSAGHVAELLAALPGHKVRSSESDSAPAEPVTDVGHVTAPAEPVTDVGHVTAVGRIPRVFVSHSQTDDIFSRAFVSGLRAAGVNVWYDEDNLGWGAIREVIEREMKTCEHFIGILSPDAVKSPWVRDEIDAGLHLLRAGVLRTFLLVVARPCRIPLLLSGYKRIEQTGSEVDISYAVENAAKIVFEASRTDTGTDARRN